MSPARETFLNQPIDGMKGEENVHRILCDSPSILQKERSQTSSHSHEHERGKRQDEKDDDMRPIRELVGECHTGATKVMLKFGSNEQRCYLSKGPSEFEPGRFFSRDKI